MEENMKEQFNKLFEDAINKIPEFAKKVHPIFVKNGWKYYNDEMSENLITYNMYSLISTLRESNNINKNGFGCVSSGRLQVRATNYNYPVISFELVPETIRIY